MRAIEKLTRIFAITVPAFLPREKPISRKAKPACMNITRMPATSTQTELIPTSIGSLPSLARSRVLRSASAARGTSSASSPAPKPAAQRVLRIQSSSVKQHRGGSRRGFSSLSPCRRFIRASSPCGRAGLSPVRQHGHVVADDPATRSSARARHAFVVASARPHRLPAARRLRRGQRALRRAGLREPVGVEHQRVAGVEVGGHVRGLGPRPADQRAGEWAPGPRRRRAVPAAGGRRRRR